MLNSIYLFTMLLSFFVIQCSTEDITKWRRQKKLVTVRDGYIRLGIGQSSYKYHETMMTWHDAKDMCIQEGATLLVPEDTMEATVVVESLWNVHSNLSSPALWDPLNWVYVGISAIGTNRVFKPIDGRSINEVHHVWLPGQPDNGNGIEECVEMNRRIQYNDVKCDSLKAFICKKGGKPMTTTTTSTTSTTTSTTSTTTSTTSTTTSTTSTTTSRTPRTTISTTTDCNIQSNKLVTLETFLFWPNATVPFYINPDHFDDEQATVILKSLEMFKFETCIKFTPLMVAPSEGQHVMTFINPEGLMRCKIDTKGHSNYNPHLIVLGYNCLNTRELYMIIMRALGFPFEHNRASRDLYIDVLIENIEPSYIQLFTKDCVLPRELQKIPYDPYSIMHFGERDYSKNGHRTIKFKNPNLFQARNGLTPADIKKIGLTPSDKKRIKLVYGPECRTRDRAAKIAICRTYPGVSRRKRDVIDSGGRKLIGSPGRQTKLGPFAQGCRKL